MFGLNRLAHLAFDLVALSTIIAGVKRSTGYAPATSLIKDGSLRSFLESYFALGDTVFGMISGYVVNSKYFRRGVEKP